MEKLRGQSVWNIHVDVLESKSSLRTLTQMQLGWEHLKVASEPNLFRAIHEMNLMDLCPSSSSESIHAKKNLKINK